MKPRVLVTGGFGNLGCWITKSLLDEGFDVTVGTLSGRVPEMFKTAKILPFDLSDAVSVAGALKGKLFEAVVHAGSLNDGFTDGYYWKSYRVNVEGTSSLLHNLQKAQLQRFVYLSTFHVYGVGSGIISDSTVPNPVNDYATSHLAAESVVRQHAANGLPATVLRLTNGYGKPLVAASAKWHLVFNDLIRMAYRDEKLVLRSDPNQRRDFLWMGDIAKAVCRFCADASAPSGIFNLSFGSSVSLGELAEKIRQAFFEATGKWIEIESQVPETHATELRVDSSILWKYLGWNPSMRLQQDAFEALRAMGCSSPSSGSI
jgi:UDP-glucose 4-epimerase